MRIAKFYFSRDRTECAGSGATVKGHVGELLGGATWQLSRRVHHVRRS
jgi:hypothetical protein